MLLLNYDSVRPMHIHKALSFTHVRTRIDKQAQEHIYYRSYTSYIYKYIYYIEMTQTAKNSNK